MAWPFFFGTSRSTVPQAATPSVVPWPALFFTTSRTAQIAGLPPQVFVSDDVTVDDSPTVRFVLPVASSESLFVDEFTLVRVNLEPQLLESVAVGDEFVDLYTIQDFVALPWPVLFFFAVRPTTGIEFLTLSVSDVVDVDDVSTVVRPELPVVPVNVSDDVVVGDAFDQNVSVSVFVAATDDVVIEEVTTVVLPEGADPVRVSASDNVIVADDIDLRTVHFDFVQVDEIFSVSVIDQPFVFESVVLGESDIFIKMALPPSSDEIVGVDEFIAIRSLLPVVASDNIEVREVSSVGGVGIVTSLSVFAVDHVFIALADLSKSMTDEVSVVDSVQLVLGVTISFSVSDNLIVSEGQEGFATGAFDASAFDTSAFETVGSGTGPTIDVILNPKLLEDLTIVETTMVVGPIGLLNVSAADAVSAGELAAVAIPVLPIAQTEPIFVGEFTNIQTGEAVLVSAADTLSVGELTTIIRAQLVLSITEPISVGEIITGSVPVLFVRGREDLAVIDDTFFNMVITSPRARRKFYVRHIQTVG